jgi:hypothetical protein
VPWSDVHRRVQPRILVVSTKGNDSLLVAQQGLNLKVTHSLIFICVCKSFHALYLNSVVSSPVVFKLNCQLQKHQEKNCIQKVNYESITHVTTNVSVLSKYQSNNAITQNKVLNKHFK